MYRYKRLIFTIDYPDGTSLEKIDLILNDHGEDGWRVINEYHGHGKIMYLLELAENDE